MSGNKIFIPFKDSSKIGGPTTFMRNLKNYLDMNNYSYAKKPYFAKGIFFPVLYDLRIIRLIKLFGGKAIQRLDGIYYPSQHGPGFEIMNKDIEKIYRHFADFVIFQSEYSRKQCFAMMGEKKDQEYAIIHNGVDTEVFYPAKYPKIISQSKPVKLMMSGSFRKLAMIEPVVRALDSLSEKQEFELNIAGPILHDELKPFLNRDYVKYLGPLSHSQLAEKLRQSHIFLHSQLNDNCPNAVLEAVSCGLPVVGFDSGAMSELLFFQKELLAYVSDEIFQKYEDFDWKKLAEKIMLSVEDYDKFKTAAIKYSSSYSFEECGKKYVEVFENI